MLLYKLEDGTPVYMYSGLGIYHLIDKATHKPLLN